MSLAEYHHFVQDARACKRINIDDLYESDTSLADFASKHPDEPVSMLEQERLSHELESQIEELPERERELIYFYYVKGLKLREIGTMWNLSESRVAQVHARALKRLKGKLEAWYNQ